MRVTINDLAKATGYSKTTISFAFNDPGQISKKALDKIHTTAAQMGYVPDPVARSLSKRRMGTLGLLLPQPIPLALENPYMVHLIRGLGEVCNREGLSLTMLPPTRGNLLNSVRTAAVDGFVTVGLHPEHDIVQVLQNRHVPFVTIDGTAGEGIPSITINDRDAAAMAMNHLLDYGHTRVGVVTMVDERIPDQEEYSRTGIERLDGYRSALELRGIDWDSSAVRKISVPVSIEGGRQAARGILADPNAPTGIVCMSDIIALGLVQEFLRAGKRIPEDLSIIGFDDIPEAAMLQPGLTTIAQPAEEKGIRAAELLVQMIHKEVVAERVEFKCSLVSRGSVAPPGPRENE